MLEAIWIITSKPTIKKVMDGDIEVEQLDTIPCQPWRDEYGNRITDLFSNQQAADNFKLAEPQIFESGEVTVEPMPISTGIKFIVEVIRHKIDSFTWDTESRANPVILSAEELIFKLVDTAFEDGVASAGGA